MADSAPLLRECARKGTEGSNPSLSASFYKNPSSEGLFCAYRPRIDKVTNSCFPMICKTDCLDLLPKLRMASQFKLNFDT